MFSCKTIKLKAKLCIQLCVCVCDGERETKLNHIQDGQTKQAIAAITELCDALAATQSEIIYCGLEKTNIPCSYRV